MSKKILILIIVIIILSVSALLIFSSFTKDNTQTKTTDGDGTNFLSEFFPFWRNNNKSDQGTKNQPADVSGTGSSAENLNMERLAKVSNLPIAGYTVFNQERYKEESTINTEESPISPEIETVPSLRYVERSTGNVYQSFVDKNTERKLTVTTVPQIYEAYLGNNGESVIMRYLKGDNKTIESFIGSLPKEILGGDTSSNGLNGSFLPENITDMSVSPNSMFIFYLFNSGDSVLGITADANGKQKNQVFASPFTEWLTSWPNDRMITLTTKPSYSFSGFMYALDPNTKKLTKILDGIKGLTTLTSPSGKMVLYGNNNLALKIYNIDTESSSTVGIKTLPEKCVWSKTSMFLYCSVPKYASGMNYPDTWYQGEISFSDEIWKINIENGNTTLLADPVLFSGGEEIDGIKLGLDEAEKYLFLINKKDSTFWKLVLN